ncbi:MFS general substrate transporter [Pisolithus croceorrhizus]|nr:MFS general substrate transporter [Pisolithus croceorrhizus]KAI6113313.1 MFS general substrate transporter [Pisolithus croceorrhizus]KAI6162595.1 MFS general substrate transporter [Pisolithus thermaeus]
MLKEKTLVPPDIELGFTPAEPNTIGDDQKTNKKTSEDITNKCAKYVSGAPDGGFKAWSVIVASMLTTFCTLPSLSLGSFKSIMSKSFYPKKVAFIFLPGLLTGRLFDLGHFKIPFFTASCGLIACTFLTAECKQYWQFFLVQGLFTGLFGGIIYAQAMSVVPHWFSKKKGTALGIVSIGSSLGGILFPTAGQNLLPLVGFKWTVRVFGFMMLVALGIANLGIDRRLPSVNIEGGLVNLSAFRYPAYTIYCISGITCYLGLYTVPTYLPLSATAVGMSDNFSFLLIAVTNVASGLGRLSAGFLADQIGEGLAGILTFAWPYASSQGALIGVSLLYGIASGTYVSLIVAPAMAMGDVSDVGRRVGMFLTIATLGTLVGTPISGAINARTGGFKDPGFYAGGVVIFSALLLCVVRYLQLGRLHGKC